MNAPPPPYGEAAELPRFDTIELRVILLEMENQGESLFAVVVARQKKTFRNRDGSAVHELQQTPNKLGL